MTISVEVKPGARKNAIEEVGEHAYRIWVTARPHKGAANTAVIATLAKHLRIAKSTIVLRSGANARKKVFSIV